MNVDQTAMADELAQFILEELASDREIQEVNADDDLLESSLVDSLGIMRLITFIDQRFGFAVPSEDIVIENFLTINAIVDYLKSKHSENVD